jgi:hypothetical protein
MTQMIELIVPGATGGNGGSVFTFNNQNFLGDKPVLSLETYSSTDVTKSPTGVDVVTPDIIKNAYLTLYLTNPDFDNNQGQWILDLPLWDLHNINNQTDPYNKHIFEMAGQIIMWEKCFIRLGSAIGNTDPISFLINVGFYWPKGVN